MRIRGHDDSHQLHPWIAPNPRSHNGLAFMHGHHPETHNYRSACARTGLAASRRPSLVIQKIHRLGVASRTTGGDVDDENRRTHDDGSGALGKNSPPTSAVAIRL